MTLEVAKASEEIRTGTQLKCGVCLHLLMEQVAGASWSPAALISVKIGFCRLAQLSLCRCASVSLCRVLWPRAPAAAAAVFYWSPDCRRSFVIVKLVWKPLKTNCPMQQWGPTAAPLLLPCHIHVGVFYLLISTTTYTTHVLYVYDILFKVRMIHQYARHTNSGDKCYKNIQKVQEKRQLQQTTELCITGLWTVDPLYLHSGAAGVWGLANCALSVAEPRAGPAPSSLLQQDTRLLNTANMWGIT